MSFTRGFLFVLVAAMVATAAGAGVSSPRAAVDEPIRLSYNSDLVAAGFPEPLLRATVRGQVVWFLVDTGAAVHTTASWFVKSAHLAPQNATATITDVTGATTTVPTIGPLAIVIGDGREVTLGRGVIADFPPIFAAQQIAGLISPQLLAQNGEAAVLNLRAPSLAFVPFEGGVASLPQVRSVTTAGTSVCQGTDPTLPSRRYGGSVTVAGIPGEVVIDTGAPHTLIVSGSRIGRAITARATDAGSIQGVGMVAGAGTGGEPVRTATGVTVARGGAATKVDVTLGATGDICGVDGLIGMDSLRPCTLVLGQRAFAWSCTVQ